MTHHLDPVLKGNILVVDDTTANLRLLYQALTEEGYQVRAVVDGEMALTAVEMMPPDLILLDIQMPKMDGYEVCKKLQSSPKTCEIPIIFLSAYTDTFNKVKAFELGGADYITKPIQVPELLVRVKNQLQLKAAQSKIIQLNQELEERVKERTSQLEREIAKYQEAQTQLRHMAFHDSLTGLPNRGLFLELLKKAIERFQKQTNELFAVLFLDCDRFKVINDSLGHLVGDKILIEVARRLESCLDSNHTISRLGGDEFTILLERLEDINSAISITQDIHKKLKLPFDVEGREIYLSASIGIVPGTLNYDKPENILRDADTAMYQAKKLGKDRYQVFSLDMGIHAQNALRLETELRLALKQNQLSVYYQPIISLKTNSISGFEALVRWDHPTTGFISPVDFIPVAEETGLIIPLGMWVLREACSQFKTWQQQYFHTPNSKISVNLSVKQFSQPDLIDQIDKILIETGVEGKHLKLEITESAIIDNVESATWIFQQLRARQITISIDDFGTGYSSLSYLHRFPVDTLKIDRSFINCIDGKGKNVGIVQAIVTMAHYLKMDIIAEGVETQQQLDQLKIFQCEYAQGYFFSKPVAGQLIDQMLADPNYLNKSKTIEGVS